MPVPRKRNALAAAVGVAVLSAAAIAAPRASANVGLHVTEFLPDPTGTDVDREWFEIHNSGTLAIDLSGYAAGDGTDPTNNSTGEGMGVFPAGSVINPGQAVVIAANANGFKGLYGFSPNYEFANSTSTLGNDPAVPDLPQKANWGNASGSLGIANGGDDVGILTPDSVAAAFTFVDGGNHGTVTTFYPGAATLGSNQSYERIMSDIDTDSVNDWVVRTSGSATPGQVAVSAPEPAALGAIGMAGTALLWRRRRAAK